MSEAEPVQCTRVVAAAAALDDAAWTPGAVVLRTAQDEAMAVDGELESIEDQHAITVTDTSWARVPLDRSELGLAMERLAAWPTPGQGFAQGMVGGIAAKVWVEPGGDGWFLLNRTVVDDFLERLRAALESGSA